MNTTDVIKGFGRMFYIASPAETTFPDRESVPSFVAKAPPYFFALILLEWSLKFLQGETPRINDGVMSVVHGLLMILMEVLVSSSVAKGYIFVHENFCLYPLPWDSPVTWIVAAIGIDFCYYWVHRAAHEVNLLWAAHQVHHSAEEYNLTTALRQSAFQTFGSWPFYLPLALFVPPSHALVHKELNLLYQFWIHTELVPTLGPLDYILNTASHHKVHHGANRYCLDKNYAGVLIIWDRMFGTFEPENPEVEIVYGLVDQPQFWNPIKHQIFYYGKVWEKAMSMKTWSDFFSAFWKGPGWFPGTERLGDITFVAENPVREKFGPKIPVLLHIYTLSHFTAMFLLADSINALSKTSDMRTLLLMVLYCGWGLTNIGMLYERKLHGWMSETLRCVLSLIIFNSISSLFIVNSSFIYYLFFVSASISGIMTLNLSSIKK